MSCALRHSVPVLQCEAQTFLLLKDLQVCLHNPLTTPPTPSFTQPARQQQELNRHGGERCSVDKRRTNRLLRITMSYEGQVSELMDI